MRLKRLPALSVTEGPKALMPRLWPTPLRGLELEAITRLKFDVSVALEMLHRAQI